MASITRTLAPKLEDNLEQLDQIASEQSVPEIGWSDYAGSAFTEAYKNNTSYSLGAYIMGQGSPTYNKDQLNELYPEVPQDYWKGSANAVQAELLYDRFKASQEKQELYNLLANVSSPNAQNTGLMADVVGAGSALGAGLADPINMAAGYVGYGASTVLGPVMTKFAPTFMNTVASSRMGMSLFNEVGQNLIADVAITNTLNQSFLNEYDQQDRTLWDTVKSSVGTAVIFGALRGLGKKSPTTGGDDFVDGVVKQNFDRITDRSNAATNSEAANLAVYNKATTHTATSPNPNISSSVTTRMATSAFNNANRAEFDTNEASFFGAYEKNSGTSDYPSARFGDTHVFVSSADSAQGIINTFGEQTTYEIYGHNGNAKLLDLETTLSSEYPQILDKIEAEFGVTIWDQLKGLDDDPSLADVFRAINELPNPEGKSGFDIVDMYDEINKGLSTEGYDGTLHNEAIGDGHQVMSIFKDKINESNMTKLHEGRSVVRPPEVDSHKIIDRIEAPIRTMDGQEILADAKVDHDSFYDEDIEFTNAYGDLNDKNTLKEIQESINAEVKIEDHVKEVEADLKARSKLDEKQAMVSMDKHLQKAKAIKDKGYTFDIEKNTDFTRDTWGSYENRLLIKNKNGDRVGYVEFTDGQINKTRVVLEAQRQGLATEAYRKIEEFLGKPVKPGSDQSQEAEALWAQKDRPFGNPDGTITKTSKQLTPDELREIYFQEMMDKYKEDLKADPPEKQEEFAKAVENCLRKG